MARRKNPDAAPDYLVHWLETGEEPSTDQPDDWFDFILINENGLRSAWQAARKDIMPAWVRQHPCSRHYAWWRYDAPQKREKFVMKGQLFFESQAAYLKRHDLLSDGEARHLAKHKELLEPVLHFRRFER